FIPDEENPHCGGEGTDIQTPEERHAPIGKLLPEMCTLDCGSTNFGNMLYMSPTDWLEKQAKLVQDSGVKPELECFDTGHLRFANDLVEKGLIDGDLLYLLCLGIRWRSSADAAPRSSFRSRAPENGRWADSGIGLSQNPMAAEAVLQVGTVAVG